MSFKRLKAIGVVASVLDEIVPYAKVTEDNSLQASIPVTMGSAFRLDNGKTDQVEYKESVLINVAFHFVSQTFVERVATIRVNTQ